jgi:hypothetical protein
LAEREFCIVKAGEVLPVEPKAFRVLVFLLRNPHRLIGKDELLDAVWNDRAVSENSLTRSIALLRRLLGDDTREPALHRHGAYRWLSLSVRCGGYGEWLRWAGCGFADCSVGIQAATEDD